MQEDTRFINKLQRVDAMAPKAEKKPAKKVAKTAKTGGKKKSRAKVESFKIYIYKVLKQVRYLLWVFAGLQTVSIDFISRQMKR